MNIQKIVLTVAIVSILLAALPAAASAATVSVGDATTVGSTATVPINVSGAPDIGAMTITLTYDSSVLSATGVLKGTITSDALLIIEDTINSSGGISDTDNEMMRNYGAIIGYITDNRVNISMVSTDGFSGDGTIAEITFTKVAGGTCPLTLSTVTAHETATCDPCTNETVLDPASYPVIPIDTIDGEYVSEEEELAGDINGNGIVDMGELFGAIDAYMAGTVDMTYLFGAIDAYMTTA
ncbi:MAG: Cohesin domain protein [Candidatus Argoarchaeum ethanivorans]|uniref:Cohesin domain protein n=1 Tax=Candidatus Argoarchaeum ethanivorans TaxID=2608793 RepID=A0A811T942_9EURY|nr:MAG: Cohesin domain protein [Candidatus Argoarchaeum ethanivorans]